MKIDRYYVRKPYVARLLIQQPINPLFMDGHPLSQKDSKRILIAYCLWFNLLEDVCSRLDSLYAGVGVVSGFCRTCSEDQILKWILAFLSEDVKTTVSTFKDLLQVIRHLPDNGKTLRSRGSKNYSKRILRQMCAEYDVQTSSIAYTVMLPFIKRLIECEEPAVFREVNTLLQFVIRVTLNDVDWIEEDAIQDYKDLEQQLHSQSYDEELLDDMATVIGAWFKDFRIDKPVNKHGYGATAEVARSKGTALKYDNMIVTREFWRCMSSVCWSPAPTVWPDVSSKLLLSDTTWYDLPSNENFECKYNLVPKGIDKKRGVSMEPTATQFSQKLMAEALDKHFQRHPEMRIDLHVQERNKALALVGSSNRKFGTCDLSSASDTVTNYIVERAFSKTPFVLRQYLRDARTSYCRLPDGSLVHLEKYAPMGSALCFPIECTIFSALIKAVSVRHGVHQDYLVYGDDMVIGDLIWDAVIAALQRLNFKVNLDKSFAPGSPFTESCGIECYKGVDVSPIRLARKFDLLSAYEWFLEMSFHSCRLHGNFSKDVKSRSSRVLEKLLHSPCVTQLGALYSLGNAAYRRGYSSLRRSVIRITKEIFPLCVFSKNEEYGFRCESSYVHDGPFLPDWRIPVMIIKGETDRGPEEVAYWRLLEQYEATGARSLKLIGPNLTYDPEDRLEGAAGEARTQLSIVECPYYVLMREPTDPDIVNQGLTNLLRRSNFLQMKSYVDVSTWSQIVTYGL